MTKIEQKVWDLIVRHQQGLGVSAFDLPVGQRGAFRSLEKAGKIECRTVKGQHRWFPK